MIKYAILFATAVVLAQGQRSPYAGSRNRGIQVLPQYLPVETNTIDAATEVGNRIGAEDSTSSSTPAEYTPYDPYNDADLIERIKTWPREQQPFWFLNRQHIQKQLGGSS